MAQELAGRKIAILATDRFEEAELTEPQKALRAAGATVEVVAPQAGEIQGMNHHDLGHKVTVDRTLDEARPEDYDALVLPGGVANPDQLRTIPQAVAFVRAFFDADKPVAAICHGPWTIVEAGCARGRRIASWPSLKTDLRNAGADWIDREVITDRWLVTSRKPDDLPAFNGAMIRLFAEHAPKRRAAE